MIARPRPTIPNSSTLPHPTIHTSLKCSRDITGLPTGTHNNNGLPDPPHESPGVSGPMIQEGGGQPPDQPQTGHPKRGRIGDRLTRSTRKIFKAIARKPFGC